MLYVWLKTGGIVCESVFEPGLFEIAILKIDSEKDKTLALAPATQVIAKA
jgi:hypothetical protein